MEKLKIYTASFYQVRNLEPNMIPMSTAKGEPSWYHDNRDRSYTFIDKRGVYNGLVAEHFQFDESLVEKVECSKQCNLKPFECSFMKAYRKSIDKFDFDVIINNFIAVSNKIKRELKFKGDPIIILLVYEQVIK